MSESAPSRMAARGSDGTQSSIDVLRADLPSAPVVLGAEEP